MTSLQKLICYQRPRRNKPLDEWDMQVASVEPEQMNYTIKFGGKEIVLESTGTYLKISSEKANMPEITGYIDCEFFNTAWKELGLL